MGKDKKAKKAKKKKKGSLLVNLILVVMLLAGMGLLFYPTISDYWNSMHASRAIADYDSIVENLSDTDYEALFEAAQQYNEEIQSLASPLSEWLKYGNDYYSALDVTGTGVMGYISISSLRIELPIYHGTGEEVLNVAAGHLEGTSLPIGGTGTHSVICAHRGLPSAKLFTDLDQMEIGDTFTITVLNRQLTYEVDQILIVEPADTEALEIVAGQDLVTLETCTPYGINSHRLLIRGHRIANKASSANVRADASRIPTLIAALAIAIPTLFLVLILLLIISGRRSPKYSTAEIRAYVGQLDDKKDASGGHEEDKANDKDGHNEAQIEEQIEANNEEHKDEKKKEGGETDAEKDD